ncbi:hypothetical protein FRC19_002697 [Serendipita sp. 401]|nr:hypothetical protein FRC15_006221 [Serendipita sp. 397]KAG8804545.1 hypothetical protein FRC18_007084 [Serendipita sp. 400]KAG8813042.1 hypothetical protein FRC19_002697 [Serendipita sp. 401]
MLARTVARQTSLAARPNLRQIVQTRGAHMENTVYNNMPFNYRNRKTFAVKTAIFFVAGFSIPFVAVKYQLWKAKGGEA